MRILTATYLLILITLWPARCAAQVVIFGVTTITGSATSTTSIDAENPNRCVVVMVHYTSGLTVSGVTYAGLSSTSSTNPINAGVGLYVYVRTNPPNGFNNLVITTSGVGSYYATIICLYNVSTGCSSTNGAAYNNSTNVSAGSVALGNYDMAIGAMTANTGTITDLSGQSNFVAAHTVPVSGADCYFPSGTAGSYTFDWNVSTSSSGVHAVVSFCGLVDLPVELTGFQAEYNSGKHEVRLNWATASETNNDFFTIERSSDGIHYLSLLEVPGAGNSSCMVNYEAIDTKPCEGITFYRLKQTDYNGISRYPGLAMVRSSSLHDVSISAEDDQVTVRFVSKDDLPLTVSIYSLLGSKISSCRLTNIRAGENRVCMNTALTTGLYILILDR